MDAPGAAPRGRERSRGRRRGRGNKSSRSSNGINNGMAAAPNASYGEGAAGAAQLPPLQQQPPQSQAHWRQPAYDLNYSLNHQQGVHQQQQQQPPPPPQAQYTYAVPAPSAFQDGGLGNGSGAAHGQYPSQGQASKHHAANTAGYYNGGGAQGGVVNANSRTSSSTIRALGTRRFDQLPLCEPLHAAIRNVLGYEFMTKVQEQSVPVALTGSDVLAKAKTGTGKTLAFLLPALNELFVARLRGEGHGAGATWVLVISPTRELASQIEAEARQLATYMSGVVSVQVVYGGTNVRADVSRGAQLPGGCADVLVATPGRLIDLLQNHDWGRHLSRLRTLVLDEADQLLEMGFRPSITTILGMLPPKETRQQLLFSATMPRDVLDIARLALRPSPAFALVDCVGEGQADTHARVPQNVLVYRPPAQFAELAAVLQEGMLQAPDDYKIMVFFTTARLTQLHAELFSRVGSGMFPVLEIHSRKSQSHRDKTSKVFRESARVIMFTSDVSARGMDYPDVTMVVQVGLPESKAQYVHRLGRTARAGKAGVGVLMLADFESAYFLRECADQPMRQRRPMTEEELAMWQPYVQPALQAVPHTTLSMGYQAWLGFYNSNLKKVRWSQTELVQQANAFATETCGMDAPPALEAKTVGKMGLRGVPGLHVESSRHNHHHHPNGSSNGSSKRRAAASVPGRGR